MKYKKIMLAALVLLAILTIGAVSASQDADNMTVTDIEDGELNVIDSPVDESEVVALDSEDAVGDYDPNKYNVTMTVERPDEAYLYDEIFIGAELYPADEECEKYLYGDIVFYVNGEEIERDYISDAYFYFEIEEFGVYNVRLEYEGDDDFNGAFEEFTYNVTNAMYRIGVRNNEVIPYGSDTFEVYAPVANPSDIEITIKGKKFKVYYDGAADKYLCNASALNYGLNTVDIYYPGDEEFAEYSGSENITIISQIDMDDYRYFLGEPIEIYVNVPSDATGTLNVYNVVVDDEVYDEIGTAQVKNGRASVILSNLPVGVHMIYANFTGSVDVLAHGFELNVNPIITAPKTMLVGEDAYVSVLTSEGDEATVAVNYCDNDEDDYKFLTSAAVAANPTLLSLSGLPQGYHELYVQYLHDEYEYYAYTQYIYVVDSYDIGLNITYLAEKVVVDNDANYVEFAIAPFADGNLTAYVDGNAVANLTDFEFEYLYFSSDGLSIGEHTFSLNFTSEIQGNSSASAKFNVVPATIYIPSKSDINSHAMSVNNIEVHVGDAAVGTATVLIDNEVFATKVVNAVADEQTYYVFFLNDVSRGRHNVTVVYNDNKYGKAVENKTVDFGYEIRIYADDVYGIDNLIYIYVPDDLGDDLTITIDGTAYTGTRNESEIIVNPGKLNIGSHIVVVKYAGDDKYPADEFNCTFGVSPEIQRPIGGILVGSDEGVSLMLPGDAKGKLKVVIEVEEWDDIEEIDVWNVYSTQEVSFENGKAYFSLANLPVGNYEISASYTGNDYEVDEVSFDLDVNPVDWGRDNLIIGENRTVSFVARDNTPNRLGLILSRIIDDEKEWDDPVNVIEILEIDFTGRVSHTFTNLKYGHYHIFLACDGFQDGFYFNVGAPDVEAESGEFLIGTVPSMTIKFPDAANGTVTVIVHANYTTKEVPDLYKTVDYSVNGATTIDLNEILTDVGNFRLYFKYAGNYGEFDSEYYGYKITQTPIIPVSANLIATASDIKEGQTAVIDISINANATGKVTVDGSEVAITNGKGQFKISNLAAGTYTYSVTFAGDPLFLNDTATVSFTVSKNQVVKDPVITAKDTSVLYTANGKFSVTVYGTDGKAANGAEVVFKVNGKQVAKVKTNANGVATYTVKQTPGTYKISATALGKTATKKLTVKHLVTLKTVKIKKSAKKLVLQATLAKVNGKYLKNKKITFKFNGKKYTAKTNKKGVAKVTIKSKVLKKLKVGKKVTYQATYLKDTVKKTAKVKK